MFDFFKKRRKKKEEKKKLEEVFIQVFLCFLFFSLEFFVD